MQYVFTGEKRVSHKSETRSLFVFVIILCGFCAIILASLATFLAVPQQKAKEEDEGKQMLISAKILSYKGYFQIKNDSGTYVPGVFDAQKNIIIPYEGNSERIPAAIGDQVLTVLSNRIEPFLVNDKGELFTFADKNINYKEYLKDNAKTGYANLPLKLIYKIYDNTYPEKTITGYIFPINGYGLWGPVYGYLAIQSDGKTVIGTTWYNQGETAGLGAEISSEEWQKQFFGKSIFQPNEDGSIDPKSSPLGIQVVKGEVSQLYGDSPRAQNSVDGISGATLTGKGVTNAYHDSLNPYLPFLTTLRESNAQ